MRLDPLVGKFGEHAPSFWLIILGRQVGLVFVDAVLSTALLGERKSVAYLQAGTFVAILALALVVHVRVKPYAAAVMPGLHQNQLEALLLALNVVQAAVATLYRALLNGGSSAAGAVDICLLILIVSTPTVLVSIYVKRKCIQKKPPKSTEVDQVQV